MAHPSATQALDLSRPLNARSHDPLYHHLRTSLTYVLNIWLYFQYYQFELDIDCVLPRARSPSYPLHLYECQYDIYTIFRSISKSGQQISNTGLGDGFQKLSKKCRRAILTLYTCNTFCFVFSDVVYRLLKDTGDVVKVDWHNAEILPPEVYVWDFEVGKEGCSRHDFLIITMRRGKDEQGKDILSRYVLDVAGFQFGFPDFFYEYEDYFNKYVLGGRSQAREFGEEMDLLSEDAIMNGSTKACFHLRDLLSEMSLEELKTFEGLDN